MTAITYAPPPPVVSIHVLAWRDGRPPVEQSGVDVSRGSGVQTVACSAGTDTVVIFARADNAYLVDGPFVCPAEDGARQPDSVWRRTLRIRAPPRVHTPVAWVSAARQPQDGWPRCVWQETIAECWGSAVDARGVFAMSDGDRTWWTVVTAESVPTDFQESGWGRLLVVSDGDQRAKVVVSIAHPVSSPNRRAAVRLETALVPGAHAVTLGAGTTWVYGTQTPASAWIEVRADGAAPAYFSLEEVARAPAALPLWVALDPARTLDGVARASQGSVAAGAIVTMFRLIDASSPPGNAREAPRRVFAGERLADASGGFRFDAIGDADYEIVAWHPQFGRGIAPVGRGDTSVTVRLESAGQVRGRVIASGKPVAGVDVISLPAPDAYAQAADLTDLKGGDGRTGPDGRFVVTVAPGGGGEVRVGGGSYPIRRFPLPRVPLPFVDLGDIDLGAPIEVSVALDRDAACDIRATGPIGRSGLQVITAKPAGPGLFRITFPEEGTWEVHLLCGRDEHALEPPLISISQANNGKEVRLVIR